MFDASYLLPVSVYLVIVYTQMIPLNERIYTEHI